MFDPDNFRFGLIETIYVISGILVLLMGLVVSFRERGTAVGRVYFLFTLSLSVWIFHSGLLMASLDYATAQALLLPTNIPVVFIPAALFHYTRILIYKNREQYFQIQLLWSISAAFALMQALNVYFSYPQLFKFGHYTRYDTIGYIYLVYFAAVVTWSYVTFIRESLLLRYNLDAKRRLRILGLALVVSLFATTDFLPTLGFDIQPFGAPFVLLLFSATAYVTWRYRLVDVTADFATQNLLQILPSPLLIFDLEGNIRLCNPAAEKAFRKNLNNFQCDLFGKIQQSSKRFVKEPQITIDYDMELDGKQHFYEVTVAPIHSKQKTLLAYTCLFTDVTERMRFQLALTTARDQLELRVEERTAELQYEIDCHKATVTELEQAKEKALEANQAKSLFLSRMSHELRTPMNAILGFSQLMRTELYKIPDPDHKMFVEQIHTAGSHLLSLITDILDLSRIELDRLKLQMESVAVLDTLQECAHLVRHMADSKGVIIEIDNSVCQGQYLYADKTRLKQAIINLINNAVKYNKEEGEIKIYCEDHGDTIRLCIQDSGIGIPEDMMDKVFIPFERLSNVPKYSEGVGIGLALSQHLIQLQGGQMGFESNEGEGSTFWLEMPRASMNQSDGFSPMV